VILESLHHEIRVHKTPKGSGSFDPTHRELLDLVCEFPYQNSGIGVMSDFGVIAS
jgi:hypothetical protein